MRARVERDAHAAPAPPLHDGQWVRPVSTRATEDSTFKLHTVDGDLVLVTAREFFEDNAADAELRAAIIALAVGECFRDGGGAAPEWSIERVS